MKPRGRSRPGYGYIVAFRFLIRVVYNTDFMGPGAADDINHRGNTCAALYAAVSSGHLKMVEVLLDTGADINSMCNNRTALQAAAKGGHLDAVEVLPDSRADINPEFGQRCKPQPQPKSDISI